jgi:addiction module RelE/StbE family toxin
MRIRWTPEATADLEQIGDHIARDNPEAALRTVRSVFDRINDLSTFPHRGRPGSEKGTRELVLAPLPYICAYRVVENIVQILHVWYGAQDWR